MAGYFDLAGRSAVVTGAAGGIGSAVAAALAESGAAVLVTDVDGDAAAAVAERISASGGRADSAALDVTDRDSAEAAAAKAALIGFTKSLARELATKRICVNALAPLAATPMTETIRTNEKFAANMMNRIPMKRWAEPSEVAGPFVFMASDAASYVTGQVLPVDGGMVM